MMVFLFLFLSHINLKINPGRMWVKKLCEYKKKAEVKFTIQYWTYCLCTLTSWIKKTGLWVLRKCRSVILQKVSLLYRCHLRLSEGGPTTTPDFPAHWYFPSAPQCTPCVSFFLHWHSVVSPHSPLNEWDKRGEVEERTPRWTDGQRRFLWPGHHSIPELNLCYLY